MRKFLLSICFGALAAFAAGGANAQDWSMPTGDNANTR